ncbi:MAG: hypothetical protein GF344_07405 [Chitinivibrionales bacterium]|nr:hypothetical protein [Chitinivibrionales bacterium]MBD3356734.1 hypothetical protein [Chitinivibrionales bacterium]
MGRKRKSSSGRGRPQLKLVKGTGGKGGTRKEPEAMPLRDEIGIGAMAEQYAQLHQELLEGVMRGLKKASRGRKKEPVTIDVFDPYSASAFEALAERLGLDYSRKKRSGKYSFSLIIVPHAADEIFIPFWNMLRGMLEQQLTEASEAFISMAVHGEIPDGAEDEEWDLGPLIDEFEDLDDDDIPF